MSGQPIDSGALLASLPASPVRVDTIDGATFVTSFSKEHGMRILACCEPLLADWIVSNLNEMIANDKVEFQEGNE